MQVGFAQPLYTTLHYTTRVLVLLGHVILFVFICLSTVWYAEFHCCHPEFYTGLRAHDDRRARSVDFFPGRFQPETSEGESTWTSVSG